ncbi:uncharacterized protein LOC105838598 [Monomorium pharaonis]|uniref:uncharacterized protein LOC105838598 n=1 Tax=Monomorium pharaonis TaxID=307658 RepID=UPI00063F979D|nr:uncharacterized protein LOC105838598 [Monomorium pharaonis]XP_012539735.1 uncharacterized protein LOC105838598 [Monomorium pharaonis]
MAYILGKASILCRSGFRMNIIPGSINKNTFVRSYEYLSNKTNPWAEQKYKQKDNISDNYQLVYREQSFINLVTTSGYHIGWLGLVTSTICLGYVIYKKPPVQEKGSEDAPTTEVIRPLTAMERIVLLFLSFVISTVLIVGTRTLPFRIYHDPVGKMYKAVFVSRILGKKQIETFGEGTVVPVFSRKSLGDLLFNINGRVVILDKECFPVQYVRERMLRKNSAAE